MPGYKGHLAGGVVAFGLVMFVLVLEQPTLSTGAEWLACALVGALFPDIDTKSKGQKWLYRLMLLIFAFLFIKQRFELIALMSLMLMVPLVVRHRGLTHKLWFIVALPTAAALFAAARLPQYADLFFWDALFFIAGAVSHLWLDLGFLKMFRR